MAKRMIHPMQAGRVYWQLMAATTAWRMTQLGLCWLYIHALNQQTG